MAYRQEIAKSEAISDRIDDAEKPYLVEIDEGVALYSDGTTRRIEPIEE